jgi:DNA-binding CsgD family transcriptional regulator
VELLGAYSKRTDVLRAVQRLVAEPTEHRSSTDAIGADRQRRHRLKPEERTEIARRYGEGQSVYALAAFFGVSRQTISGALERSGIQRRYRMLDDACLEQARELYQSGMSLANVGDALHVSAKTVLNAFRAAGIQTRAVGTNQWT